MFGNSGNEAKNPNWNNGNWLKSRFHFSFAEYNSYKNQGFGVMRVMNDDLVQPARGFGTHPHRNMEIATYIVNGTLSHKDSMGSAESLGAGGVQFMTAGSGVSHSEHNLDPTTPLRFIQIWIKPRTMNLKPNYGSMTGDATARRNQWQHVVSDVQSASPTPVKLNQDTNIFVTEIDDGKTLELNLKEGRQAYVLCISGKDVNVSADGSGLDSLQGYDAAEAIGPAKLQFVGSGNTHLLVVEMAHDEQAHGRSDL